MSAFGLLIIGDELLSGKRQDKHLGRVIAMLAQRGLELSWARILGDEPRVLVRNLRESFAGGDIVFSCGGIGATPDDRTRQCVAEALQLPLALQPEGVAEIEAQFGERAWPQRVKMAEFPQGAEIIPNPVNRVSGFSLRDHHFVPGFPHMAWPMLEWVLDTHYPHLHAPGAVAEQAIIVRDAREGDLIPLMEDFVARYPALRLSCLPSGASEQYYLELGLRGAGELVASAMQALRAELEARGYRWEPIALT
ncbi:competence/damage-inducible protein A [Alkalilimnicola sp. S0819]|uniref:competence/damage-inducible protein A n=1 Tax=Alkalilimnicola sp. S0819 TaxID=2613922 RepID=UPI001261F5C3|nr:molybdopterin-binding protein [Alkalilimnicola sp. S0819]KAB7619533.1 competence/damage-inducible protein A [Alkalilimnicola sp. S0819]MPQ17640.1 competence/damage-inducible protein A [Alkalilimnicola sp. S0819]